jgi:ABC-type lipoprotein export system ATPase subunit
MQLKRALEQHIAVFGESGSGKTVMLSSFYGATQCWATASMSIVATCCVGMG